MEHSFNLVPDDYNQIQIMLIAICFRIFGTCMSVLFTIEVTNPMLFKGWFTLVTSDCDHRFLKCLFDWEMSSGLILFYTRWPKLEVIVDEHVKKCTRCDMESYTHTHTHTICI